MTRRTAMALAGMAMICLVSGCESGEAPVDVVYDCGEVSLRVTYGEDLVVVRTGEEEYSLPIAISASGARFSDGEVEFWEHQGTARFETPTDVYQECVPVQRE